MRYKLYDYNYADEVQIIEFCEQREIEIEMSHQENMSINIVEKFRESPLL